ncbi:L-serine ammonia-lyase [Francisella philomiragia]|uniref:L-serine dehydratase n=1 Tax=Francisella philomiragia TaxID=28110 RepID=A0AAW3DDI3_9GAMM|nr:L-serine ammonia-lyase [Francisella philomiragia]KFJ43855.1 L-serine ammonia-lyase [Francisella philomiragia]MBK2254522.1 L-serine ammonia-lyase [Francisella philomiragia]MBK2272685.1 L-serine ammonia-lyase [Francisella philomiragia]MBK2276676.1 L-serine ammonia-lyase [Francisella philomiragia]MBK2280797.1 L-serine ammonia-lyase [Francisella philomiragia]
MESTFELFSIGVGPSSSHTIGPMRAGCNFIDLYKDKLPETTRVQIDLFGSLALTGKGHKTDYAVVLGVMGFLPESVDIELAKKLYEACLEQKKLNLAQKFEIKFDYDKDLIFHYNEFLPEHSNGMRFSLFNNDDLLCEKEYFSIGGGFIVDKKQIRKDEVPTEIECNKPYRFTSMAELKDICYKENMSIDEIMFENEKTAYGEEYSLNKLAEIWQVMDTSIEKGLTCPEAILPGGLKVRKRAPSMIRKLKEQNIVNTDFNYLNAFAIAVNEQNACGERVVTAPTNGAAGVIPAVLKYYLQTHEIINQQELKKVVNKYLLVCAAIGILYKSGASISAAEVGCQGEVGVACSMAAAGYCALLGGDIESIESAAEIGMEHNLGLTCDPIGGLVQIPCIERNAMGAVQAINAAKLAHLDTGEKRFVGLDYVIKVMYETGLDMSSKYKETSLGGLATNVPVC